MLLTSPRQLCPQPPTRIQLRHYQLHQLQSLRILDRLHTQNHLQLLLRARSVKTHLRLRMLVQAQKLRVIRRHDIIVRLFGAPDETLDRVALVVDYEDDNLALRLDHGPDLLDSKCHAAIARHQDRAARIEKEFCTCDVNAENSGGCEADGAVVDLRYEAYRRRECDVA
jgi:hypothetical protein